MRTYQHSAFTALARYDILYGGHKRDAGVGSGRRRRFLDLYEFRNSTMLWNVFVIDVRESVVFSVVQTVTELKELGEFRFREVRLGWKYSP
jgi:hypothetical protein